MTINAVDERIIELYSEAVERGDVNKSEIARQLKKELDLPQEFDAVRKMVERTIAKVDTQKNKSREVLNELEEELEENKQYEVEERDGKHFLYVYTVKQDKFGEKVKARHEIPFEFLTEIRGRYTREGGWNWSQTKILQYYNIQPKVWRKIKSVLDLTKDQGLMPRILLDIISDEEGPEGVERVIESSAFKSLDKYRRIEEEKLKSVKDREVSRVIGIIQQRELWLEQLKVYLQTHKPLELTKIVPVKGQTDDSICVVTSDYHFGENSKQIEENVRKLAGQLIARPEKNIDLFVLGDLVETIVEGGMHPGQIERMDGVYGCDLIMFVVNIFEWLLKELYTNGKIVRFHGIGGNHDRIAKDHKEDIYREGATIIYELILRGLEKFNINIKYYREKVNVLDIGEARYIFAHGEDKFAQKAEKTPEKILWEYGDPSKANILLYGHLHRMYHFNPRDNAYVFGAPAMAPNNKYSKDNSLSSRSGYGIIKVNQKNDVDFITKYI